MVNFDLEEIAAIISTIFAPLGKPLELVAAATGQKWGIVPDEKLFWFRPAGFHVFEYLVIGPFLYYLWITYGVPCTQRLLGRNRPAPPPPPSPRPPNRHHPTSLSVSPSSSLAAASPPASPTCLTPNHSFYYNSAKPSFVTDALLGLTMLLCWISQVVFKASRPNPVVQLFWMVVPCHVITITWAFVLLSPPSLRNYQLCRFLAALLSMSSWGGVMASLFPDWSDHQYLIEGVMFYVHHGALLAIPHYWAAKHGMLRLTADLFWTYIVVALGINFFIYTPLCYVSGVNINYNLHPHLGMKHRTQWYRFIVPVVLAIWGLVYWYFTVFLNKVYYALFVRAGRSTSWIPGKDNSYEVLSPMVLSRETSCSPPPSASSSANNKNHPVQHEQIMIDFSGRKTKRPKTSAPLAAPYNNDDDGDTSKKKSTTCRGPTPSKKRGQRSSSTNKKN